MHIHSCMHLFRCATLLHNPMRDFDLGSNRMWSVIGLRSNLFGAMSASSAQNPVAAAPPRPDALLQAAQQVRAIVDDAEPTLLNKTVNRIRHEVKIPNMEALERVVRTIFEMVVNDAVDDHEHDCSKKARCGETYADILFGVRMVCPTFPTAYDKPMTFNRILLNLTQDTFEDWCAKFANAEKAAACDEETQNKLIVLVSFIGHLYVRRLVAARVVAQVVHDLIGVRDRMPEEPLIRCVCALMQCIGLAIDANKQGNFRGSRYLT